MDEQQNEPTSEKPVKDQPGNLADSNPPEGPPENQGN